MNNTRCAIYGAGSPIYDRIAEIIKRCQSGERKPEPAKIRLFDACGKP